MAAPSGNFGPVAARMRAAGLPEIVVRTFEHYYDLLAAGETGLVPEEFQGYRLSINDSFAIRIGMARFAKSPGCQDALVGVDV